MRIHHPGKTSSADEPGRTATPAAGLRAAISRAAVGDVSGGRGQPLAAPVTAGIGARLGGDFSHVPVYSGSAARAAAAEAGAHVGTSGSHVVVGDGGANTHILALQRSIGDAAVSRMLQQAPHRHGAGCGHQRTAPPARVQRSAVHDVLSRSGQPLAAPVKEEMEARLGADFSDVRVHTDSAASASAAAISARAYTSGSHVVIGDGGADTHTLAHELTHVIQQRQGWVTGTETADRLTISNPADRIERAAEATAAQAVSGPAPMWHVARPVTLHEPVPAVARMPTGQPTANMPTGQPNQKPWVVFGTDGKNEGQLETAVQAGYRRFDTAQSYGNAKQLAKVLDDAKLAREDYEILYKFDIGNQDGETLRRHLTDVAKLFQNKLNAVVIHNFDDTTPDQLKVAWPVLTKLKAERIAERIGVGNIGLRQLGQLPDPRQIDVVEQKIAHAISGADIEEAIKRTGAELYYYDVINTAKEIGLNPNSPAHLNALIAWMSSRFEEPQKTSVIMSSGQAERQKTILESFGGGPPEVDYDTDTVDAQVMIHNWTQKLSVVQENDESFKLPDKLRALLGGLLDNAEPPEARKESEAGIAEWLAEKLKGTGKAEVEEARELLENTKVPARRGLRKRYVGMSLGKVLEKLLGQSTCDWKWSIELVQLMVCSVEDWEQVGPSFAEIADFSKIPASQ